MANFADTTLALERQAPAPHVFTKDGAVFANSRDVASHFGKRHDDVLRKIDSLLRQAPPLRLRNFTETQNSVMLPTGGARQDRSFDVDRDGFSLLAMGFTGAKALQWKLLWIEAFNAMEAELRARSDRFSANICPGFFRMRLGAREVLVDASVYQIGAGDEAVVCGHDGKIEILPGPLEPSSMSYELGNRSVAGPERPTSPRRTERTLYTVLGRVMPADAKREGEKPVRVRAHRRALPAPAAVPDVFSAGSDVLRDLYSAVMSANVRVQRGQADTFGQAVEDVLAYHIERRDNPLWEPRRPGTILDWNGKRIDKRRQEREVGLREKGLLPFPQSGVR